MPRRGKESWLMVILGVVGLVPAAILGLWAYTWATAETLHPDPKGVPAVATSVPERQWADAIGRGQAIVRAALVEQNLPGLSVAVGVKGQQAWAEGFGWADLEKRIRVTPDTRFRIGTASPALTSVAVGLLVEQGRLKPDDEIQTYVPEYPRKQWPVTLRQLMGHTSGLGNDGGDEGPLYGRHCLRPVDALEAFGDAPLRFEPDTKYRYSSYGWILVSAAVEAAAHEPFVTFMRTKVFEPLGMNHTREDSPTEPDLATFYFPRFAADPRYGLHLMRDVDYSCYAGASVFLSTPSDLVRFAMAIDAGGLLQPATVTLLETSQRLASGPETGYGLGWDLETVTLAGKTTRAVGVDGKSLGGPVTSLWSFPDHGIVVAVASNMSYADTAGIALKVAGAFAGR